MQRYIDLIHNETLKGFIQNTISLPEVAACLSKPSTYNGHYHPKDEFVENGLALHTLRVANVALQMYRCLPDMNEQDQDRLIIGALLHDVPYKWSVETGYPNNNHPADNAKWFFELEAAQRLDKESYEKIGSIILNHAGKWNVSYSDLFKQYPMNELSWIVHLSDNIASRENVFVDINDVGYLKGNVL